MGWGEKKKVKGWSTEEMKNKTKRRQGGRYWRND